MYNRVVVVGAGCAGAEAARILEKGLFSKTEIVLVERRDFYWYSLGALRDLVQDIDNDIFFKLDKSFDRVKVHLSGAKRLEDHKIVLEDGTEYDFDYALVATGSNWASPIDIPQHIGDAKQVMAKARAEIKAAENVVVAGGGAVAIELAGELKETFPEKTVSLLVRSSAVLSDQYPMHYRAYLQKQLSELGVNLVLNDSVDEHQASGNFATRQGTRFEKSLILRMYGPQARTELMATLDDSVVTANGIKVTEQLTVQGHPTIFAAGDCINLPENKQGIKAADRGALAAKNIILAIEGKALKNKGKVPDIIVVSVGRERGAIYVPFLGGWTLGNWAAKRAKSRDLLIPRFAKSYKHSLA